jgi:uncharacterized protein (DUF427 family)
MRFASMRRAGPLTATSPVFRRLDERMNAAEYGGNQIVKTVKVPNSEHPITIERNGSRVRVTVAGRVVADTTRALTLRESDYPPVAYVPRADVDMSLLERSDNKSYCPYKGDAAYYSIAIGGSRGRNAVWTYEAPHDAVADIKEHLAFYPDRVDSIEETPGRAPARSD